jgi:hypothetical protein
MVLQDAQTRLFFKAQAVIQAEIRGFQPRAEDLAYPQKLVGACVVACAVCVCAVHMSKWACMLMYACIDTKGAAGAPGVPLKEKDTVSQIFRGASLERRETWYPTLAKTVWVLSQLHDFVQVRPHFPRVRLVC